MSQIAPAVDFPFRADQSAVSECGRRPQETLPSELMSRLRADFGDFATAEDFHIPPENLQETAAGKATNPAEIPRLTRWEKSSPQ